MDLISFHIGLEERRTGIWRARRRRGGSFFLPWGVEFGVAGSRQMLWLSPNDQTCNLPLRPLDSQSGSSFLTP